MTYAAHDFAEQLKLSSEQLMALGRVNPADKHEPFCMTVLALKISRAANAVSELHGEVSRHMWQCLYPGVAQDKVPIGHITNGVHVAGWMKVTCGGSGASASRTGTPKPSPPAPGCSRFWQTGQGHDWANQINSPDFWQKMLDPKFVSDEELWALRYELRRE